MQNQDFILTYCVLMLTLVGISGCGDHSTVSTALYDNVSSYTSNSYYEQQRTHDFQRQQQEAQKQRESKEYQGQTQRVYEDKKGISLFDLIGPFIPGPRIIPVRPLLPLFKDKKSRKL